MNSAIIVRANGEEEKLDHRPSLGEAQQIVGGYIEILPVNGKTLVVNGDGRPKRLPINDKATRIYEYKTYILGDVIVLEGWRTVGK